jgi:hypothetical protein
VIHVTTATRGKEKLNERRRKRFRGGDAGAGGRKAEAQAGKKDKPAKKARSAKKQLKRVFRGCTVWLLRREQRQRQRR